jgi:tRNA U34 2-thiouridine synthase MnmA/TrmU
MYAIEKTDIFRRRTIDNCYGYNHNSHENSNHDCSQEESFRMIWKSAAEHGRRILVTGHDVNIIHEKASEHSRYILCSLAVI